MEQVLWKKKKNYGKYEKVFNKKFNVINKYKLIKLIALASFYSFSGYFVHNRFLKFELQNLQNLKKTSLSMMFPFFHEKITQFCKII